jgi:hypothetical protein
MSEYAWSSGSPTLFEVPTIAPITYLLAAADEIIYQAFAEAVATLDDAPV